jgi:outer membrane protein
MLYPRSLILLRAVKVRTLNAQCVLAVLLLAASSPAGAETLKEALTAAYLYNPTLKSARAQLRSTDNGVAAAKSGYRPTVTAQAQAGYEALKTKTAGSSSSGNLAVCPGAVSSTGTCPGGSASTVPLSTLTGGGTTNGVGHPRTAQAAFQQTVFDGFRTYNNVKGSEALVEAGREDLRAAEMAVLLNTATAYMNVVRDQAIVNLRKNGVKVLQEQLAATQRRHQVGEVTNTDLAQAKAALAQAQADLSIAQGMLYGDRAMFEQYTGHRPGTLKDPGPPSKLLPKSIEAALAIAEAENPGILGAIFRERAQAHQVKQAKGQLLPALSASGSYTRSDEAGGPSSRLQDDTQVTATLTVPIYQAGQVSAQIRQSIEILSQRRQQILELRDLTRAQLSSQWGLIVAAKGNTAAGKSAVEAAKTALQGVRSEENVGQRTILDVLNAEQQYLNAQVNLASFQRDLVVASYGVLAAMGRLTAYDLALQAELYDPARYYGEVKDAWYGWGASIETRQDPAVAPVKDRGSGPGQTAAGGPAYSQNLPPLP